MKWMIGAASALAVALVAQHIDAHGEHVHSLKNPDDPIEARMYLMENVGANTKQLKAKLDAGQIADAALYAGAIALHASQMPSLFPPDSISDASRAKPEIWQQWDGFVQAAHGLRDAAEEVGHAASQDRGDEAKAKARAVFGSCKSCHDTFRKPKES